MKNLSLFVSAFALFASTSYAAIDCGTLPSCASLGYTDTVVNCPGGVIKCPFDTTKGKCQLGPSVGDLKYSLNTANHNGWILCNGQSLDKTAYGALFNVIGTNYGGDGAKFRVPDYRGFFLRAAGTATNNKALSSFGGSAHNDLKTPQKEQLPNITGYFYIAENIAVSAGESFSVENAYSASTYRSKGAGSNTTFRFNASKTLGSGNGVYQDNGHVIPANYVANVFIYAGVNGPTTTAFYRCNICGYVHEGSAAPTKCPSCASSSFTKSN